MASVFVEGTWKWLYVSLNGSIDGFQALARSKTPVLKVQELLMGKKSMASPERKATSMNLVALPIRVAGSSSLFFDERNVMARTNVKRI